MEHADFADGAHAGQPARCRYGSRTTGVDVANANTLATASFLVITGATAGNLQIRFASEVANSNAVVKAGSHLVATKVA